MLDTSCFHSGRGQAVQWVELRKYIASKIREVIIFTKTGSVLEVRLDQHTVVVIVTVRVWHHIV